VRLGNGTPIGRRRSLSCALGILTCPFCVMSTTPRWASATATSRTTGIRGRQSEGRTCTCVRSGTDNKHITDHCWHHPQAQLLLLKSLQLPVLLLDSMVCNCRVAAVTMTCHGASPCGALRWVSRWRLEPWLTAAAAMQPPATL
jgi:hypothetical protein